MSRIDEAKEILHALGLPKAQQNEIAALTLLALARVPQTGTWSGAQRESLTITKGIMDFIAREYGRTYAPNTRETFRRQVLHQFVQAHIVEYNPDSPDLPTNSPRAHYALTEAALTVLQSFGTDQWQAVVEQFLREQGSLLSVYQRNRKRQLVPVRLPDGTEVELSPGKHNILQAAIIEEFAPRFAPGASLLYMGDTTRKMLILETDSLTKLGINVTEHDKLPDIILHDTQKNWLFLVEAVTSHGPMTPKRVVELQAALAVCKVGCVYVTAFPDFAEFRKHLNAIAWETEVWIAEMPDHLIHFNGDRFLGPR